MELNFVSRAQQLDTKQNCEFTWTASSKRVTSSEMWSQRSRSRWRRRWLEGMPSSSGSISSPIMKNTNSTRKEGILQPSEKYLSKWGNSQNH